MSAMLQIWARAVRKANSAATKQKSALECRLSGSRKVKDREAGNKPPVLPNLTPASRVLRFDLGDCSLIALSIEPFGTMQMPSDVQAIVAIVIRRHNAPPYNSGSFPVTLGRRSADASDGDAKRRKLILNELI